MSFAVKVYALADKYELLQLQTLAAQRFKAVCDPKTDLTDFINATTLIEDCSNPNDATLWEVVIPVIKKNIAYLLQNEESKALILGMKELNVMLLRLLDGSKVSDVSSPHNLPRYGEAREELSEDEDSDEEDEKLEAALRQRLNGRWRRRGQGRRLG